MVIWGWDCLGWSLHLQCRYSDRFDAVILHQKIWSRHIVVIIPACLVGYRGSIPRGIASICGYSSAIEQDAFNIEVAGLIPAARTSIAPFDYREGRHPFKVERWVRFPYGVPRCTASLYAVAGRLPQLQLDPRSGLASASQTATRVLRKRT